KVCVLYHGGEPLLNKHFADMARAIKALGIPFVKTVSNGMLLTQPIIEALVDSGLDAIEFSLDGVSPAQNNFIRRAGDYETVVAHIKALVAYKQHTGSARPQISISSTQFLPAPPDIERYKDLDPAPPGYLREEFAEEVAAGEIDFKTTWAMQWPHMEVETDVYDLYEDTEDSYQNQCDHVQSTMTVRWNGDVVGCCYDLTSQFVLGNIHEANLSEIWNNQKYRGLRRSIENQKYIPLCANCNVVRPNVYLLLKSEVLLTV
ncbi:MAG: SPASM domain-containing protein, partial [Caldilineaceae bacterium]|nr:SPASM domain-containing protein [Caldilineaceae bacterium]